MIINNTDYQARHPWPHDIHLQGSRRGLVFQQDGSRYTTAFVEAFPERAFLRGEGEDLAAAEDACWSQYLTWRDCDDGTGEHGPYEARQYTNGSGHCTRCGIWMSGVLPKQDHPADHEPGLLERALTGTVEAVVDVIDAIVDADRPGRW